MSAYPVTMLIGLTGNDVIAAMANVAAVVAVRAAGL